VTGKSAPVLMAALGGRLVLRRTVSVTSFWDDIRAHRATFAVSGFVANLLMAQPERPDDSDNPLLVTIQGPAVADVEAFERRFAVRVGVSYGMTEIGFPLVNRQVDNTNAAAAGYVKRGYQLRTIRADGSDCDDGEAGELLVRAAHPAMMNAGYVGVAPDPSQWRDDGWFATGDAFKRDSSGLYTFVDRMKDSIRRRGENISSFDIEAAALGFDGVAEAAAVGVPAGGHSDEVHLVVVATEGGAIDVRELHGRLSCVLPRFMVPRYYTVMAALPKTANGKVRKIELRSLPPAAADLDTAVG
jgi:crotonobetaine/carnitine-CoA ligase